MFCSAELDLPAALRHQTVALSAAVLETSCRSAGFAGKKEAFRNEAELEGANDGQWEGKGAFVKPSPAKRFISYTFFMSGFHDGGRVSSEQQGAWPKQERRRRRGRNRGGSG